MARTDPQLNIRIPVELKDRLETAAKESGRSVTAEMIKRLESTFTIEGEIIRPTLPTAEVDNQDMTEVMKKLDAMVRFMEEIRKSNMDLSKLKKGKPFAMPED